MDARDLARELLETLERQAGELIPGKPLITITDAVTTYVEHLEQEEKASATEHGKLRDKLLGLGPWKCRNRWSIDGTRHLHTLEPRDMAELVKHRRAEGNGAQTIAHEIKLLRAATRHASGLRYRVPIDMIDGSAPRVWRMPTLPTKTRYLDEHEFRLVYNHLSPDRVFTVMRGGRQLRPYEMKGRVREQRQDAQDLLVALVMCGGRWSEVAGLRWDRVDTVALAAWGAWKATGRTDAQPLVTMTIWGSKGQKERLLGCPEMACEVLWRRWQARQPGQSLAFPSLKTGRQFAAGCRPILRAMNECGLNTEERVRESGRATVHSLRHTYASWLLQNGATLPDIQQALGHSTMTMTRRYSHLGERESAAKLAGILSTAVHLPSK